MKEVGKFGQWSLSSDNEGYNISNIGDDGTKRFYEVVAGPYGNPVIIAEPDLAFPVPSTVDYVDSQGSKSNPTEKIAGIICKRAGEVVHRFSLSSPGKPDFVFEKEGAELVIDGVRSYLRALFRKDGNRFVNYDAFYGEEKPDSVRIVELQDLVF